VHPVATILSCITPALNAQHHAQVPSATPLLVEMYLDMLGENNNMHPLPSKDMFKDTSASALRWGLKLRTGGGQNSVGWVVTTSQDKLQRATDRRAREPWERALL